jgi:ABC-type ATPase with predicted acetyltransferase domain
MTLFIEFPMMVISDYNGADGVNETLDDHITDLVLQPFEERDIEAKLVKIDFVDPVPNANDELVRYEIEADIEAKDFRANWFQQAFEAEGYEKGLTIKDHHGESLYHDEDTADIVLRRKVKMK